MQNIPKGTSWLQRRRTHALSYTYLHNITHTRAYDTAGYDGYDRYPRRCNPVFLKRHDHGQVTELFFSRAGFQLPRLPRS